MLPGTVEQSWSHYYDQPRAVINCIIIIMDSLDLIMMVDYCRSRLLLSGIQDAFSTTDSPLSNQKLKKFIYSVLRKNIDIEDCRKLLDRVAVILASENSDFKQESFEKLIKSYQIDQKKFRIVWQECDEIKAGHGVVLYDKILSRQNSGMDKR